ncbi:hypothetical protein DFH06DRAFT_1043523 [Mycena polygramma]|nr:hypothetical protein DFH06DRAFT_1043523 [Mycena polygramma]
MTARLPKRYINLVLSAVERCLIPVQPLTMASSNQTTELPNPLTPLAFFPPDIAVQVQIGSYILVGTMGAVVWDILCNIQNDYKLIFKYRVGFATYLYFFSRLWSLVYILSSTLFETYPLGGCAAMERFLGFCFIFAVPTTSGLFFLRARAIYNRNPYFVAFISILWLSVLATSALIPSAITAGTIGPTKYCLNVSAHPYAGAVGVAPLVHDTFISLAISWRLFQNSYVDRGFKGNARAFLTGESLPGFSKAILQDGQLYYLVAVTSNTLVVAMFYNTHVATTYRTMFTVCNIMVTNAMACHVFRNTKFGLHQRIITTSEMTTMRVTQTLPRFAPNSRIRTDVRIPKEASSETMDLQDMPSKATGLTGANSTETLPRFAPIQNSRAKTEVHVSKATVVTSDAMELQDTGSQKGD